jgi:hypothetical protein
MKKQEHSFSLIELLLGLLIFSILALTLYSMFSTGLKVDEKSTYISRSYQEARLAFEVLGSDLENAFIYDLSGSYPDTSSFVGESTRLSLIRPSAGGIKYIQFYLDLPDFGSVTRTIIGQRVEKLKGFVINSKEETPIRFLMRQETSLLNYLSKSQDKDQQSQPPEIVSAGIKKDSLRFHYGAVQRDSTGKPIGTQDLTWTDNWNEKSLPSAVRVEMTLFDPQNPDKSMVLKRDIYLAPLDFKPQ